MPCCPTPLHKPYFFNSGNRQQNTSPYPSFGKIPVPKNRTLATGRRAASWRMRVYQQCFVPNYRTTSEVGTTGDTWSLLPTLSRLSSLWMRRSCYPTLRRRSALGSTAIVSRLIDLPLALLIDDMHPDWAYVEDWCRRLTGSFSDVYVFTIPLYLPKQDPDGKWRVVSIFPDDIW
jgi:hypothetical protein